MVKVESRCFLTVFLKRLRAIGIFVRSIGFDSNEGVSTYELYRGGQTIDLMTQNPGFTSIQDPSDDKSNVELLEVVTHILLDTKFNMHNMHN